MHLWASPNPLEESRSNPYTLNVCATLLTMGVVQGVKPDDMVEFFASQIPVMLACPPNYRMFGKAEQIWVLRGFYPNTSVFFKLSVIKKNNTTYVKASVPFVKAGTRRTGNNANLIFQGIDINKTMTDKMENALLDAKHKIEPIVSEKLRIPRCMSPRGMKLFTYKKTQ